MWMRAHMKWKARGSKDVKSYYIRYDVRAEEK